MLLPPVLPEPKAGAVPPPPKEDGVFCSAPDAAVPPNSGAAEVAAGVVLPPAEPNKPPPDEAPKVNGDAPGVCVALLPLPLPLPLPPKSPPVWLLAFPWEKSDGPEAGLSADALLPSEKGEGAGLAFEPAAEEPKVNFGGSDMASLSGAGTACWAGASAILSPTALPAVVAVVGRACGAA